MLAADLREVEYDIVFLNREGQGHKQSQLLDVDLELENWRKAKEGAEGTH